MLSRRQFLQSAAALGAATFFWRGDTLYARSKETRSSALIATIPGGTLDPLSVPKFQGPVLIPPAMPRAGRLWTWGGKTVDYYEIAMRQFQQQILPSGMPQTTVWGYGSTCKGPQIFNAPSLTIEAKYGTPVRIKWSNELMDAKGNYLPHLLPVDPTLHWANPPGGTMGRDTRPTFTSTPGRYTGPVPIVTHVHGSAEVGDESDGYAEAWYLPNAKNIPAGYADRGTWYNFFRRKATLKWLVSPFRLTWEKGSAVFQYPNSQRASTLWYHDHTLGMTRLNVYAGPAGFFIVRGGPGDKVVDRRTGKAAVLPGPAPAQGDRAGVKYYEIPLAIQDRSFNTDGSLFYPDSRAFFDGWTGPYIPDTDISPIWNPEFFGNMMMVNGNTWPYLDVEKRRYRFRFLNGCDARFLILDFSGVPGVEVWMIGNEGGFLAAPVNLTATNGNKLLMGPAERADMIVDFTNVPNGHYVLGNVGPDAPFGELPLEPDELADPNSTGQIMQFRVGPALAADKSTPPQFLTLPSITPISVANAKVRRLALLENMSQYTDGPAEALLGTVVGDPTVGDPLDPTTWPMAEHKMWMEPVTENPQAGDTEIWEFYNATADSHPMHIHDVFFQVVDRQPIFVDEMGHHVLIQPGSTPLQPEAWENGFKDTVIAYPGYVTRVKAKFVNSGQFVWHCHIVEHEDNEMMRPYRVGPEQQGQPGSMHASAVEATDELDELVGVESADWGATNPQVFLPDVRGN